MKKTLLTFFTLLTVSSLFAGFCDDDEYYVLGEIKCVGDCGKPDCIIIVKNPDGEVMGEIKVDSYRPYRFSGCIKKNGATHVTLEVVFNQSDNLGVATKDMRYYNSRKEIRIKRIEHLYYESKTKANKQYQEGKYEDGLETVEEFEQHGYNISSGQNFELTHLKADCYYKLRQLPQAASVLETLLAEEKSLNNQQKFEVNSYLSKLYFEQQDYVKQKTALQRIDSEVNLTAIGSKTRVDNYYKEVFNNYLLVSGFNTYTQMPSLETGQAIVNGEANISVEEWNSFYKDFVERYQLTPLNSTGSTLNDQTIQLQIEQGMEKINGL